jgi:hypothetical protein
METEIGRIDRAIDANHEELQQRIGRRIRALPSSWQKAWDAHPDLRERESALYRERSFAQQERDAKAAKMVARKQVRQQLKSRKQCPTCGFHTLAA